MKSILVVEDDFALGELLELVLMNNGFKVLLARSKNETHELLNRDLSMVLLDLNLPDGDGRDLIPSIIHLNIPIIILTAQNSLTDRVKGLNLGADDYITKPFESLELVARVNALLRRTVKESGPICLGEALLNFSEKKATVNDMDVEMTFKEWELLQYLVDNRGVVISRESLMDSVWGYDYLGTTRTVDVHIQKIRQKLKITSIKTVYKQGYRLDL